MPDDNPFAALPREAHPPPHLRDRVLGDLRRRGLVRRGPSRVGRGLLGLAAGVALFALGAWVGGRETLSTTGQPFALLLYEPAGFDTTRSHQELAAEYGAWAAGLGTGFVAGDALGEQRTLGGPVGDQVPTGYFIIRADDWDAALAIARGCPHLRHGGVVAVRAVGS
jgi:hypothetical protein